MGALGSSAALQAANSKKPSAKSIITCKICLKHGYGWCPIRRKCGGFLNRKCRGDHTDKALPAVHAARDNLNTILASSQKHSLLFMYDDSEKSHVLRESFLSIGHELKSSRELLSLDLNCTTYNDYCNILLGRDGVTYPVVKLFREGTVSMDDSLDISLNYSPDVIINHLKTFRGRHPEMENLAGEYTLALFMTDPARELDESHDVYIDALVREAKELYEKAGSNKRLASRYVHWMEKCLQLKHKDIGFLSQSMNKANLDVSEASSRQDYTNAQHEVDVLSAFIAPLFKKQV